MLLVDTHILLDVIQNQGWPLLTRDASRFKTYFPTLQVLAP